MPGIVWDDERAGSNQKIVWDEPPKPPKPATPRPALMSEERLGPAVDYLQMLNPLNIPAAAKRFAGAFEPGPVAPLGETLTKTIPGKLREAGQGLFGMVAPPLLAAGAVAAPLPTAAFLAASEAVSRGGQYLQEKTGALPELMGLGTDILGLAVGGKAAKALAPRPAAPPLPKRLAPLQPIAQKLLPAAGETYTASTGRTLVSPEGVAMRVSGTPAGAVPRATAMFTEGAQRAPQMELPVGPVEGGLRVQDVPLGAMPFEVPYQRQLRPTPEAMFPQPQAGTLPLPPGSIAAPKLAPGGLPVKPMQPRPTGAKADLGPLLGTAKARAAQLEQEAAATKAKLGATVRQRAELEKVSLETEKRMKDLGPPEGMAERRAPRAPRPDAKALIEQAGGEYKGIQEGIGKIPRQVLFNDPQTGTTLAMPIEKVTPEAVKAHIAESRAKFAEPEAATTLRSTFDPRAITEAYTEHIGKPLAQAGKNLLKAAIGKSGLGPYLLERYGQPAEYIEAAKGRKTAIGIQAEKGLELGQRLTGKLSQPQQESLGRFIAGQMSEADLRLVRSDARFADAVDAAKQARTELDSLGGQAVMQGLFQEETFVKNYGKYLPRLYRKWEVDYDATLQKYGEKKPTRLDLSRFMRRQDIPEEVRLLMGEIKEPGYPVAKGIAQMGHDVETAKLFNFVADNPKWSATNLDELTAAGLKPEQFTQMPTTPKLGKLSGRLVDRYIADDLNQIIRTKTEAEKVGRALLSEWKYSKVVLNPATHSRNLMSNTLLAYLGGLPPVRLDIYGKALRELKSQGPIYREAQQAGITGRTTFAGAEFDTLIDSWNATKGGPMERFARMGQKLRERKPSEALKEIRPSQTKAGQKASQLYQAEEQWFKLAKFMHNREKGMTAKVAAADAQKWLFDYSEVPKAVDWARRSPFGAPFITFTYKALPAIAESAITHPWRLATIAYTLNTIVEQGEKSLGMGEQEKRRVEKVLPERFKGSLAKLSPKFLLLPWKDRYGQLQYLDLTYILPWGDIGETGATGLPQQLLSNPVFSLLSELKSGRSAFTGQEIVRPQATGTEAAADRAKFAYRQLSPSLAPGGYGFERMRKAIQEQPDYFGRTTSIPSAAASVLLGLKVSPIDLKREGFFRQRELEQGMVELRKEAFRVRSNRGLTPEQKKEQLGALREKAKLLRPQGLSQ